MRRMIGVVAALALVLAGCGSSDTGGVAAKTPGGVASTASSISTAATPVAGSLSSSSSSSLEESQITTMTTSGEESTEVEEEAPPSEEVVTSSSEKTRTRISEKAACQLMFNGPGGTDGAIVRLSDLILKDLQKEITQSEAADIAARAIDIRDELIDLQSVAPVDWEPYLQAHIDITTEIIDGMISGEGVQLDTDDYRAAGYELTTRCGAG